MVTHPEICMVANPGSILDNVMEDIGFGVALYSGRYFLEGVYHSPSGARLVGGSKALWMKAPRLPRDAVKLAVFCGLYSAFECGVAHARRKEDPWNSITAFAAACGVIPLSRSLRPLYSSAASAVFGGVAFASCQGAIIGVNKLKANEDFRA